MDGGKRDLVEITQEVLDVAAISASVTHPSTGAVALMSILLIIFVHIFDNKRSQYLLFC